MNLFSSLGFRPAIRRRGHRCDRSGPSRPADKDCHIVIFTGHLIDEPGRAVRRFPPEAVGNARLLISRHLQDLQDTGAKLQVLASGAPEATSSAMRYVAR